jgi:hypothetical protein
MPNDNTKATSAAVSVQTLPHGGIEVEVKVPTYTGLASFKIEVERDNDVAEEWRVAIPWLAGGDAERLTDEVTIDGGYGCSNGIVYLGTPEDQEVFEITRVTPTAEPTS